MTCRPARLASLIVTIALVSAVFSAGLHAQRHKNEEPKPQVLPLPPEPPMALKAATESLDFHISPLLKTGGLAAQIRQSLNDLIRDTKGETIVRLRAFVAGAGDARQVRAEVGQLFTEHKLPLPVLTVLQVAALGDDAAQVVIEAVVSTRRTLNPSGLAFIAGQEGGTLQDALQKLKDSAATASVSPDHVLTATCFTGLLDGESGVRSMVRNMFPNTAFNVVQAIRDPANEDSMCEATGQPSQTPGDAQVLLLKQPRVAIVTSHELVFTGLQLSFGNYLDDAHEAVVRLERSASAFGSVEAPVQVNVFALDASAGSALRKTTTVPLSVFTVQTAEGMPSIDATAGMEAIFAPGVTTPLER